jgi:hypothetical protein
VTRGAGQIIYIKKSIYTLQISLLTGIFILYTAFLHDPNSNLIKRDYRLFVHRMLAGDLSLKKSGFQRTFYH